jgi:hypothetical protein
MRKMSKRKSIWSWLWREGLSFGFFSQVDTKAPSSLSKLSNKDEEENAESKALSVDTNITTMKKVISEIETIIEQELADMAKETFEGLSKRKLFDELKKKALFLAPMQSREQ